MMKPDRLLHSVAGCLRHVQSSANATQLLVPTCSMRMLSLYARAGGSCSADEQQKHLSTILNSLSERIIGASERSQPFVTLTYAQSLDGCIAHKSADRLQLSGSSSAVMTHRLRAMHDAILIGVGTVLADDPKLTVRLAPGQNPLPVVLDANLHTPCSSQLVAAAAERPTDTGPGLIIISTQDADSGKSARREMLMAQAGVQVRSVSSAVGGGVSLPEVLIVLKQDFGASSVMVEGGAKVIGSFLAAAEELVDFLVITVAPCFLGGIAPATALREIQKRSQTALSVDMVDLKACRLDDDLIFSGKPQQRPLRPQQPLSSTPALRQSPEIAQQVLPRQRWAVDFCQPGRARVFQEEIPLRGTDQMTVRATCSAISAGTERTVLISGLQVEGEPLDTSLSTLSGQEGGWPIRYGYCLVGCVLYSKYLSPGTRVFCFHPHASVAHVEEADAKQIPDDISDEDAAFFANMETACSLLQDGGPVVGDRIAVFGAGTVGMLTVAILAHHRHDVTIFDPQGSRTATILKRFPEVKVCDGDKLEFDLSIEVSGAPGALSEAVNRTRKSGRLLVGSLYGELGVSLPLGLRYHRSQMTIVASQVSHVSPALSGRWTKERRTELTWEMLRRLRPASWVPTQGHSIEAAADAYRQLIIGSEGSAVQHLLTYPCQDEGLES